MTGFLLVDKPVSVTSHDVVDAVRRRFGLGKVGHAGTLDPFATGLLVLLVGSATKRAQEFLAHLKEYEAVFRLGISTDTGDCDGRVTRDDSGKPVEPGRLETALDRVRSSSVHTLPAYSAARYQGERLYRRARKGEDLPSLKKPLKLQALDLVSFEPPDAQVRIRCGAGTYVRGLAIDLGAFLGIGAHVRRLRRLASGPYRVEDALGLGELLALTAEELPRFLVVSRETHD